MDEDANEFPNICENALEEISLETFIEDEVHDVQELIKQYDTTLEDIIRRFAKKEGLTEKEVEEKVEYGYQEGYDEPYLETDDESDEDQQLPTKKEIRYHVAFLFLYAPRTKKHLELWKMSIDHTHEVSEDEDLSQKIKELSLGADCNVERMYQRMFKSKQLDPNKETRETQDSKTYGSDFGGAEGEKSRVTRDGSDEKISVKFLETNTSDLIPRILEDMFNKYNEHLGAMPKIQYSNNKGENVKGIEDRVKAKQEFIDSTKKDFWGDLEFVYTQEDILGVQRHTFENIKYHLSLQQDARLRKDEIDVLYSKFPGARFPEDKIVRRDLAVYTREDIQKGIKQFKQIAKETAKCYVVFLGHGNDKGAAVLEKDPLKPIVETVEPIDLLDDILALKEDGSILPRAIQFAPAHCYGFFLEKLALSKTGGSVMTVSAPTKRVPKSKNVAGCRIGLYPVNIPIGDKTSTVTEIKYSKHVQLTNIWPPDLAEQAGGMAGAEGKTGESSGAGDESGPSSSVKVQQISDTLVKR